MKEFKIKLKKEDFKKILRKMICYKRLFFVMFFGGLLIFTFEIIYKHAFLNIKYIDYTADSSFVIADGKINNVNLSRVLRNIDEDQENIETKINKEYRSPFSFDELELLDENFDLDNLDADELN